MDEPVAESASNHKEEPEVVYELHLDGFHPSGIDRDEVNGWIETCKKAGKAYYEVKGQKKEVERQEREHQFGILFDFLDRFFF
jgi:hypothetical protein